MDQPAIAKRWYLRKIVTGGQTGVDRAALDVAMAYGIPCGGWCPKGRIAENGPIPEHYPLVETADAEYSERTRRNVEDADGILVLYAHTLDSGTRHTINLAADLTKPTLTVDLTREPDPADVLGWLAHFEKGVIINVAGPRESNTPGVYDQTVEYLRRLLNGVPLDDQFDQLPGA
jgi:hypothetical protein